MGDIGSDTESMIVTMIGAYLELRRENPDHELLTLISLRKSKLGMPYALLDSTPPCEF